MKLRYVVAVAAVLLLATSSAASAPAREGRTALTPLEAVNRLLAIPWAGLAAQRKRDSEQSIIEGLDEKTLVSGSGGGDALNWSFSLKIKDPHANVNVASPPGFTSATPSRLEFAIPRTGSWSFSFGGRVQGNATIKNRVGKLFTWSPSFRFGLAVRDFQLRSRLDMAAGPRGVPRVTGVDLNPSLVIGGDGALPVNVPISLTTSVSGGRIQLSGQIVNVEFGLPEIANGRLTAQLAISIERGPRTGIEIEDLVDVKTSTFKVRISLQGRFSVRLPENVGTITEDFRLITAEANLPSFDQLDEVLRSLERPLPQQWGNDNPAGQTPPPPEGVDYASPAQALEQGIAAEHLPYGAVFNRNCDAFDEDQNRRCVNPTYSGEVDSALWTGHYLAAEALRYASMRDPAALDRVRLVLGGVERLFDVTTDAAVGNGKRVAISGGRRGARVILARTAALYPAQRGRVPPTNDTTGIGFAEGPLHDRECYYEKPEGGWTVGTTRYPTFAQVPAADSARALPVGRVWRGWGCGEDHPVSRDQLVGVFLGLALAHELVDDPDVKRRARALIERALDDILANGWNIRLPPDNRISATSSFFGIFPMQLGFLRIGATVNPGKYAAAYAEVAPAAELAWIPVWFAGFDPIFQYYKFNLSNAALAPTLMLETDPVLRAGYQRAADILWGNVSHHRNAYFALLRILMQPPAQRAAFAALPPAGSNPALTPAQEIRSILADWLDRLQVVKTASGMPQYAIGDPSKQVALFPDGVGRFEELDGGRPQLALYALPPSGRSGNDQDFMWQRHPFKTTWSATSIRPGCRTTRVGPNPEDVRACGSKNRVAPGVDYLLAYWLAAYLEIVPKPTVPTVLPPPQAPAPTPSSGPEPLPAGTTVQLAAGPVTRAPLRPRTGARFTVRIRVRRPDTGALLGRGTVACSARAGTTRTRLLTRTLKRGVASCVFRIPPRSRGKLVRGTISVTASGTTVRRTFTYRAR